MRVMLTGATGLTGFHLACALARAGHEPRCLVRSEDKLRRAFQRSSLPTPDFVIGDMTDPTAVDAALEGCDAAIHAAALVGTAEDQREELMRINLRGTELVVGGAIERGCTHVGYVSSLGVIFDPWAHDTDPDGPLVDRNSPYTAAKVRCEQFVRDLQERGAPIATVYPCAINGPNDPGLAESNGGILIALEKGLPITSGGYLIVDARDLSHSIVALLSARRAGRFIVTGGYLEWRDYATMLSEISGRRVRQMKAPGWVFRGLGRVGDLLRRVTGANLPMTYESMLYATCFRPTPSAPELSELGVTFRDPRTTLDDTLRWLVAAGYARPDLVPALRPPDTA